MVSNPPICLKKTGLRFEHATVILYRKSDSHPLLVLPRDTVLYDGEVMPHAHESVYEAYTREFDAQFLRALIKVDEYIQKGWT